MQEAGGSERRRQLAVAVGRSFTSLESQLFKDQSNETGKLYLTRIKVRGMYTNRFVTGQTNVTDKHVNQAWGVIQKIAAEIER